MQYKNNDVNNFVEVFAKITAIINLLVIACFFQETCYNILKHLLAVCFKNKRLFCSNSTYFGIVETNG